MWYSFGMHSASIQFHESHWTASQVDFYEAYISGTTEIEDEYLVSSLQLDNSVNCRLWNGKVVIGIKLEERGVILDQFVSKTMRAGHGRQAFRFLKNLSDTYKVPILLMPCSISHPYEDRISELPNDCELKYFYMSEGCEDTGDHFLNYVPKLS